MRFQKLVSFVLAIVLVLCCLPSAFADPREQNPNAWSAGYSPVVVEQQEVPAGGVVHVSRDYVVTYGATGLAARFQSTPCFFLTVSLYDLATGCPMYMNDVERSVTTQVYADLSVNRTYIHVEFDFNTVCLEYKTILLESELWISGSEEDPIKCLGVIRKESNAIRIVPAPEPEDPQPAVQLLPRAAIDITADVAFPGSKTIGSTPEPAADAEASVVSESDLCAISNGRR